MVNGPQEPDEEIVQAKDINETAARSEAGELQYPEPEILSRIPLAKGISSEWLGKVIAVVLAVLLAKANVGPAPLIGDPQLSVLRVGKGDCRGREAYALRDPNMKVSHHWDGNRMRACIICGRESRLINYGKYF